MLGQPLLYFETTTSTNDAARAWAQRGAPDGALALADEQTAGRGRRGRVWLAPRGQCLLCSLILRPALPIAHAPRLTMLAAVAIARSLAAYGAAAAIKWPNDVLIKGRKVAGVLTETAIVGDRLDYAIVGMGVNLNVPAAQTGALSPYATSLLAETGRTVQRDDALRLLLAEMDALYAAMARDGGQAVFAEWRSLLETVGRNVTAAVGAAEVRGRADAVDADGALLVRQADGTTTRIAFGDVS